MKALYLLFILLGVTARAQNCEQLVKCYGENCCQQDTIIGHVGWRKTCFSKMWLSSVDTNYYVNIVFTDSISGENIKLHEPHDIHFLFCCDSVDHGVGKALIERSFYCDYSGCIVHKIPLSKHGSTAAIYSLLLDKPLAYVELYELDRRTAFRDGDMVSDGIFDIVGEAKLLEGEWQRLKDVLLCITAKR